MIAEFFNTQIINAILLLYGYFTFRAFISPSIPNQKNWLSFWVVYSILRIIEGWTDTFIWWFPFYYQIKIIIIVYMGILNGSDHYYNTKIKPWYQKRQNLIDRTIVSFQNKVIAFMGWIARLILDRLDVNNHNQGELGESYENNPPYPTIHPLHKPTQTYAKNTVNDTKTKTKYIFKYKEQTINIAVFPKTTFDELIPVLRSNFSLYPTDNFFIQDEDGAIVVFSTFAPENTVFYLIPKQLS